MSARCTDLVSGGYAISARSKRKVSGRRKRRRNSNSIDDEHDAKNSALHSAHAPHKRIMRALHGKLRHAIEHHKLGHADKHKRKRFEQKYNV